MTNYFKSVAEYPENITAASIMIRMLDGLGYRFRYATEALTHQDYQFMKIPFECPVWKGGMKNG